MPKEGVAISEHVLSGKYRLCRKLGRGAAGTVYLAFHTELEEYRAIKVVPKSLAGYETFRREALFLKTLRHPGIPIVYDVEEDLYNSYLIEEYLEGESLYALVKRLGSLSMEMAVEFCIQICRLIQFMYSAENPILYLDLQPKNLFVCNGMIRLTDFDHAQYATDVQAFGGRFGTIGFAAPEQYGGEPLDCRTDIYAVGALFFFMCLGKTPGMRPDFSGFPVRGNAGRIIRGCMAQKKEDRYQSAGDLLEVLLELQTDISKEHAINSQTIAFAGASPGIGATHAAFGLSNFLTRNGYPALYQEAHDTDTARNLAKRKHAEPDRFGVCHIGDLNLRPYYGPSVQMPYPYYPMIIKDMGVLRPEYGKIPDLPGGPEFLLVVCGGQPWELDRTIASVRNLNGRGRLILLIHHGISDIHEFRCAELRGYDCLPLPWFPDPFAADSAACACWREILIKVTGGKEWKEKRKGRRFWRRGPG